MEMGKKKKKKWREKNVTTYKWFQIECVFCHALHGKRMRETCRRHILRKGRVKLRCGFMVVTYLTQSAMLLFACLIPQLLVLTAAFFFFFFFLFNWLDLLFSGLLDSDNAFDGIVCTRTSFYKFEHVNINWITSIPARNLNFVETQSQVIRLHLRQKTKGIKCLCLTSFVSAFATYSSQSE